MNRIINYSIHHPYPVIIIIALITVFFGSQLPYVKIDPRVEIILCDNNPVERTYAANKDTFEPYADILIGMLHPESIYRPGSMRKIQDITEEIEGIDGVKKVVQILNIKNIQGNPDGLEVSPMIHESDPPSTEASLDELRQKIDSWEIYDKAYITSDNKGTAISIILEDSVETDQIVPIYYTLTDIIKSHEGSEQFFISGPKIVEALQGHYMIKDLTILPPLVCIVLMGFLLLFFRSLRGMLLPLISVGISTTWSIGIMPILDIPLTMITTALPVALMAVAIAYGVHIVENVFSDSLEGKKGLAGISNALIRVKVPVMMAALTTTAAFISLCTTPIVPLMHFGLLSSFGIIASMMLALTFIPAMLSIIDSLGKEYIPHHHTKKDIIAPLLKRLSYVSIHKHWWVIGISMLVLVVSVMFGKHVKSDLNLIEDFRKGSPIRVADDILNREFGGTSLFNVEFNTLEPDCIKDPSVLKEIEQLQKRLNEHPDIGKTVSIVDFIKRINQSMHEGDPEYYVIPESKELVAQYLLLFSFSGGGEDLESFVDFNYQNSQILLQMKSQSGYLANDIISTVEDYKENSLTNKDINGIITTGLAMLAYEFNHLVVRTQVTSFIFSFLLCFVITSTIFRSFRLGIYSMVPLIIPIALDFGIMGITGIKLNAATATVASIDIGMGIDYSIHFLSRYKHEIRMGRSVEQALTIALNTSGRGIIYNAMAVAAGFMVLIPSQFVVISQLGMLVAIDMITISLSVLTFLPAAIKILPPRLAKDVRTAPIIEIPAMVNKEARQDAVGAFRISSRNIGGLIRARGSDLFNRSKTREGENLLQ